MKFALRYNLPYNKHQINWFFLDWLNFLFVGNQQVIFITLFELNYYSMNKPVFAIQVFGNFNFLKAIILHGLCYFQS